MSNIASKNPFGNMTIDALFGADTLAGIGRRSTRWQVLEAFLRTTEARAERVYEGNSGFVILASVPGQPNTGAFYLYDENTRNFFMVTFADQETFHATVFDFVITFYDLGKYVEVPRLRLVENKRPAADKVTVAPPAQHKPTHRKKFYRPRQPRIPQAVISVGAQNRGMVVTV